jgi:hypothetical protein
MVVAAGILLEEAEKVVGSSTDPAGEDPSETSSKVRHIDVS